MARDLCSATAAESLPNATRSRRARFAGCRHEEEHPQRDLLGALSAGAWMSGCAVDPLDSAQPDRVGQAKIQLALQSFQLEDPSFHPYSSKYDRYLFKQPGGGLTPAEARGLKVFNDPHSGNCFRCHFAEILTLRATA
jgi:hypothetical protein